MPDARSRNKLSRGSATARENQVFLMRGLTLQLQLTERFIEMSNCAFDGLTIGREHEQIIRVTEIVELRKRIEPAIERREIDIGEKTRHWRPKCDALPGVPRPSLLLVGESHAFLEKPKQVISRLDQIG